MSTLEMREGCNWQGIPLDGRMTAACEGRDKGKMRSQEAWLGPFSLGADGQLHRPKLVTALQYNITNDAQISSQSARKSKIAFCATVEEGWSIYITLQNDFYAKSLNYWYFICKRTFIQLILPRYLLVTAQWDYHWFCYCHSHCLPTGTYYIYSEVGYKK